MFPSRFNTSSVSTSDAILTKAFRESVFSDTSDVLYSSHDPKNHGALRANRSHAPLINAFQESVFSDTSAVPSSSHSAHRTKGASSLRASGSANNGVPKVNGQTNTLIPYVNQPVNRRESNSYRPHRESVHFQIPPPHISNNPVQNAGDFLSPTYLTPYVSANPLLNIHPSRRSSISYRNPNPACQHDHKKQNAVQATLDILEGRPRERPSSSRVRENAKTTGLVGPSKDEGHPIHPPVYPNSIAPSSTYDYSADPDDLWEVDGPVELKRQERTRTIKAQYVPEVVRIDEAYEEEQSVGSPDSAFYARLPERTRDGDSPHPNATHFFPPTQGQMQTCEGYKCKVRRYDKKKNRHSDWCEGVIQHAYIFQPINDKDVSYYKVAFKNPILGLQSEFFFAERNEFTFNMHC